MNAAWRPEVLEFFAGAGMARLGLDGWQTAFANDFDPIKVAAYRARFGPEALRPGNVWDLALEDLPAGTADLAWASSPCQDLSLAGARRGLSGSRSGAFWGFWRLLEALDADGRAPRLVVVENVVGLLTSNGGEDFRSLCDLFAQRGWSVGALEMDAALWLPQSRPRLFIVAARSEANTLAAPQAPFHTRAIVEAHAGLSARARAAWRWWSIPTPGSPRSELADLLQPDEESAWLEPARAKVLIEMMGPLHRKKLEAVAALGGRRIGTAYRRVRIERGVKVQRLEARFDGIAGCLRTPAGGSSRQYVLVVEGGTVRARLMTPREALRLMGVADDYALPSSNSAGLKLAGDGVAVPVVRALSEGLLKPLLTGRERRAA